MSSNWTDAADRWEDRVLEKAADTIMIGLMNELPDLSLRARPSDELHHLFELLTGGRPIGPCLP